MQLIYSVIQPTLETNPIFLSINRLLSYLQKYRLFTNIIINYYHLQHHIAIKIACLEHAQYS